MRFLLALVSLLAIAACGPAPLDHTQPTAEALAREVLSAVAARDETRLRELALTEEEFEKRVWAGLPASRPERNLPWSYVWLDLRQKSDATLQRTLRALGGRRYELREVRFEGPRSEHGTYRVYRDTVLVVADPAGEPAELRILGSMLEADRGWKVFSYLVDQ
jgi:hypothetical protein